MRRIAPLIAALPAPAAAIAQDDVSPAAAARMQEQIAEACGGRGGGFVSGVHARDLTGDGRAGLILDHGGIECSTGLTRSGFCGAQVCSVLFHVRDGGTLRLVPCA